MLIGSRSAWLAFAAVMILPSVHAAPLRVDFSSTVTHVEGTYFGDIPAGLTITGTYVFDSDVDNADPSSDPNPSYVPGHEYSSFWNFVGAPYGAELHAPALDAVFTNSAPLGVVVNNDQLLPAEATGGIIPAGSYDWIELLASTTIDYCNSPCLPADGEEWTLAIFSSTDWFSGDNDIPNHLPASYTALLVGIEFDEFANEVGLTLASIDSLSVSAVPVPAAVWLFGPVLVALGWRRRR